MRQQPGNICIISNGKLDSIEHDDQSGYNRKYSIVPPARILMAVHIRNDTFANRIAKRKATLSTPCSFRGNSLLQLLRPLLFQLLDLAQGSILGMA